MAKTYDPRTFHVDHDGESFFIGDDYDDEFMPTARFSTREQAEAALDAMVEDFLKNYEPPDPPGWEGGFGENH